MRIAVLIIGLLLGLLVFLQSFVIAALGGDSDIGAGGAVGLIVAIMWLLACGLVIGFPRVSMVIFLVAGLFAFIGATSGYTDLNLWGSASLILAAMSFFGWRGKREQDREREAERERQHHRDRMLVEMMRQRQRQHAETR